MELAGLRDVHETLRDIPETLKSIHFSCQLAPFSRDIPWNTLGNIPMLVGTNHNLSFPYFISMDMVQGPFGFSAKRWL